MMALWVCLLATLLFGPAVRAEERSGSQALSYSAASIVNSASNVAGALTPNVIATIYGTGLAITTRALMLEDIRGGALPETLGDTDVRVYVGSIAAHLYFVSPNQINFLVPCNLKAGERELFIDVSGRAGPVVRVTLLDAAPALFQLDGAMAAATHADGSVVTREHPAQPSEVVVLYGTGLGRTIPDTTYGQLATAAASIRMQDDLQVTVGGVAVEGSQILYAGITPGFGGLYQINVRLPDKVATNPEIRISIGSQSSPAGVILPLLNGTDAVARE
jgi:uncharacterized protein (TIGR03437 family)